MVAETPTAEEIEPSDYQTLPKPRAPRINAEARFAPTCMMWMIVVGLGALVCMVLAWVLPALGTIDWSLIFR